MTIEELFESTDAYDNAIQEVDKLFTRLPNIKSYDWIIEVENVSDKHKYIHTAPSVKTLLRMLVWQIRHKLFLVWSVIAHSTRGDDIDGLR